MADDKTIEIRITAKNMSDAELAKARQAIAGFKRDADSARTSTSGLGGALRNASSLAGAFGVTLGVGAVVKFGKALLDDADALVKLSDKTGMSTDAVQRLKYIAEQSGNTLENLTSSVSQLQKRLGDGDDSAIAALRGLGIEVDRFQQLTPDEQFMAIAREVAKIEDPVKRVTTATQLFGKAGVEVLPSLIAKVDELADKAPVMSAKAVQAFDSVGDGLSDLWARTKNTVGEGLAQMFDGYGRLASGMKALFSGDVSSALEIFTDLAQQELPKVAGAANLVHPPLKAIALSAKDVEAIETKLDDTRKRGIESAKKYAAEQEKVASALERIGFTTPKAVAEELALYQALLKQQPTLVGVNQVQIAYLETLEQLGKAAERSSLKIPKLTTALEDARQAAAHAGDGFVAWEQSLPTVPLEQLIDMTGGQTEALDEQAVQARLLTDAYKHFGQETPEALRRVADESTRNYQVLLNSGTASTKQLTAAYAQMIADQRAVSGELPKTWSTSIVPGIKSALGTLQTAISGTFAQMMLGAKGFKDGFLDIWSSMKGALLRIFAEIADNFISGLLKRMLSALSGNKQAFAGGFSSLFAGMGGGGSGGAGATMPSMGSLFGGGAGAGGFSAYDAYASGTLSPGIEGSSLASAGGTNWGAMAGGGMMAAGGVASYIQARQSGSKMGQTLSGAMTGAGVGTMIMPGIGTAIGAGVGAIAGFASSLFGGDKEYKQVKELRAAYEQTFGGADALIKQVSESYATLGKSGAQAEAALKALWNAKTVKDYDAAVGVLNGTLEKSATLAGLQQQLAARQVMDLQVAEELTAKYGGTLGNLGQQFAAAKAQASFKTVLDDYQRLIDMGGDVGGSLFIMKEEIGALVGESLRIGTEIPAQFEPLVAELIRTNQLFTDTGEEISDISTLKFGKPLESEADTIKSAIMELVDALKTHLIPTIDRIPRNLTIKTGYEYEAYEPPEVPAGSGSGSSAGSGGDDSSTPGYAAGALITSEHLARVGEGGVPELIGPVGFMQEALAGALAAFGISRTTAPAPSPAPSALAFAGGAMPAPVFNITLQAMDPVGLKRVVEQDVAPLLVSVYRRNVNGLRTDTRRELVE